jgi:galactose mutarotase-like enzyme
MRLTNDVIEATVQPLGAELSSLRRLDTGVDYLWGGDGKFWAGHAPVLFPIVCAARNGQIQVGGKAYRIGNHGFARKSAFELVESARDRAVFRLASSDASLAMYPYRFVLSLAYTLEGDALRTTFTVENTDRGPIHFQLGTHAGFNCPIGGNDGSFGDHHLEFEKDEELTRLFLDGDNLLVPGREEKVLSGRILPLSHELFHQGALVFRDVRSTSVALRSTASPRSVVVRHDKLPYLGIWQPRDAPFVCIEPWHGIADRADASGELEDREMTIALERGGTYQCWYSIQVG